MNPPTEPTHLLTTDQGEKIVHVWGDEENNDQFWAVKTALAANRPLLIQGEPGIGKTQLAYAAAQELNRPIVSFTVDSKTEARDLLWNYDAVQRLAEAQVATNLYGNNIDELKTHIAVDNFISPGPIWWAINWQSALAQANKRAEKTPIPPEGWKSASDGIVVLIDEIDKADSDVPNGLLEALGMQQFTPQGRTTPVTIQKGAQPPLIVITTNEEQALPDPFVRRCVVLKIELPDCSSQNRQEGDDDDASTNHPFIQHLVVRGQARFDDQIPADQLTSAAKLLMNDRQVAIAKGLRPLPGQAEYFDFLRAMNVLARERRENFPEEDQAAIFAKISSDIGKFIFGKSEGSEF